MVAWPPLVRMCWRGPWLGLVGVGVVLLPVVVILLVAMARQGSEARWLWLLEEAGGDAVEGDGVDDEAPEA